MGFFPLGKNYAKKRIWIGINTGWKCIIRIEKKNSAVAHRHRCIRLNSSCVRFSRNCYPWSLSVRTLSFIRTLPFGVIKAK